MTKEEHIELIDYARHDRSKFGYYVSNLLDINIYDTHVINAEFKTVYLMELTACLEYYRENYVWDTKEVIKKEMAKYLRHK